MTLNDEGLKPQVSNRARMFTSIWQSSGRFCQTNQIRKRGKKRHKNWKGRNIYSLFADDMIIYVEKPKDSIKKLLEQRSSVKLHIQNQYTKVSGSIY